MLLPDEIRENRDVFKVFFKYTLWTFLVIFLLFICIWQSILISDKEYSLKQMEKQINLLIKQQEKLKTEVSFLSSPERLGRIARKKLGNAIRHKPDLFDQTKSRYAMDWYYPVLCGVIQGKEAERRIESLWDRFIIPGWGVRCVSDRPWVTMAETAELCICLAAMGNLSLAETLLKWISDKKYDDGSFWNRGAGYLTDEPGNCRCLKGGFGERCHRSQTRPQPETTRITLTKRFRSAW